MSTRLQAIVKNNVDDINELLNEEGEEDEGDGNEDEGNEDEGDEDEGDESESESEDDEIEEGEGIYSRDELDFDENMTHNEVEVVDLMDTDEEI